MKKCLTIIAVTLIITALVSVSVSAAINFDAEQIDNFIEEEMSISRIPGLALGIVYNGEVIYLKGHGSAGKIRNVSVQTPFIIGSVSKSFTALAVMQLAEEGRLELDKPVQEYLPWFTMAGEYDAGDITVRHLLVQTSGIPNEAGVTSLAHSSLLNIEEEVRALSSVCLAGKPGERYIYSNANYIILGLLVDVLSDSGYADHIRDNIFNPLGMTSSFLTRGEGMAAGMSDGHTQFIGFPLGGEVQYLDSALAAGFIISTAEDMCRYLLMHLGGGSYNGNRLLSEAGLAQLYKPGEVREGENLYAMGLVAVEDQAGTLIMHDGMTQGFNSGMVFSPEERWGVIVLTNIGTMLELPAMPLALAVADLIRGETPDTGSKVSRAFYLGIQALMLVLLILTVRSLILLPGRWAQRIKTEFPRGLLSLLLHLVMPVLLEVMLPLIIFIIIPAGAGFPVWRLLGLYHPDLVWGLLILSALLLVKAAWRALIFCRLKMQSK